MYACASMYTVKKKESELAVVIVGEGGNNIGGWERPQTNHLVRAQI